MLVFVGGALLMLLVVWAIQNSGPRMRSADPIRLLEPAQTNVDALESAALRAAPTWVEPEPMPEPLLFPMPEPERIIIREPVRRQQQRAPQISDRQRDQHTMRMLAASSRTAVEGFDRRSRDSGDDSDTDIDTMRLLSAMNAWNVPEARADDARVMPAAAINQSGWDAQERFLETGGARGIPDGWSPHVRRPQLTPYEIKSGTVIPAVLISGVHSDLPGNVVGQVTENVWDTATGRHLLIPQGSRLVGTYDNRVVHGQSRLLVVWSRIVFPDGSTLMLDNLSATDQAGRTGLRGRVNRHWGSIISAALIVSLLGAGAEMASGPPSPYWSGPTAREAISQNAATAVAEAMSRVIQREVDRAPTITIRPGTRFLLFVRQDMMFSEPWRHWR